jgi:hypothetical protein
MTTENNILLAEFMQPSFNGFGDYDFDGAFYKSIELLFHTDWNWLMQVVEKIQNVPSWDIDKFCSYKKGGILTTK